MTSKTIADLRDMLFVQLAELANQDEAVDLSRHRVINEVTRNIIETAKVEVALAAVLKGAMEVPFVEAQTTERPSASLPPPSAEQRVESVLHGGPAPDHPWRGLMLAGGKKR